MLASFPIGVEDVASESPKNPLSFDASFPLQGIPACEYPHKHYIARN